MHIVQNQLAEELGILPPDSDDDALSQASASAINKKKSSRAVPTSKGMGGRVDEMESFLVNKLYMNDPETFKPLEDIFERGKRGPPKKVEKKKKTPP